MEAQPVSDQDWDDAHLVSTLVDAHGDDPAFGYRCLDDELERAGIAFGERRVWRLCPQQHLWSTTIRRAAAARARPTRERRAPAPGLHRRGTEPHVGHRHHRTPTGQGKVYCCAVKDLSSNRIVGYANFDRMTAGPTVAPLGPGPPDASPRCRHRARRHGVPVPSPQPPGRPAAAGLTGAMGRVASAGDNAAMESFWAVCSTTCSTSGPGPPATDCDTRSWPGSSAPTTGGAASASSAGSPPCCMDRQARHLAAPRGPAAVVLAGDPLAFDSDDEAVLAVHARRDRLDAVIEEMAADSQFTPVVRRLGCLRGVGTLTGFALAVEVGDWRRFTGASIGSFVGLTPAEDSSGGSRSLGPITKTGTGHARRMLVEAAWHHRPRYVAGQTTRDRWDLAPAAARARCDVGNRRLHHRWVTFTDRRKRNTVANVAVARELAGWRWSLVVLD